MATTSFFFYDLETTGFNPREARIMQFAGQRTDRDLKPVGEPYNILIKLTEDVVPDPDAILLTGITPQSTLADGVTEAEFLKIFDKEISVPGTVFLGYNTVRFDDEFMRFLHYRNFYDAYAWQWQDGKSRWDLLDVVRMTRALRPEGIKWPFDSQGRPANRLESLTKVNGLDHDHAHDALSDVLASIAVAKLIRDKQPKLFDYLFEVRDKKKVAELVTSAQPFVYTSGKYDSQWEKTTVVARLGDHPKKQASFVYDLRFDPDEFKGMSVADLAAAWRRRRDEPGARLPVKSLQYNRCPAVAPLGVLDKASQERLQISLPEMMTNYKKLQQSDLPKLLPQVTEYLDKNQQSKLLTDDLDVDAQLYDGFFEDVDRTKMSVVRAAAKDELAGLDLLFKDQRLQALFPLYKARNFPASLSDEERASWERYRERKLMSGKQSSRLARYFNRLGELAQRTDLTAQDQYLLEELQLYGQSVMPVDLEG
jgi:exodeoxyribonuclease-1